MLKHEGTITQIGTIMVIPLAIETPLRQIISKKARINPAIRPVFFGFQPTCARAEAGLHALQLDTLLLPTAWRTYHGLS